MQTTDTQFDAVKEVVTRYSRTLIKIAFTYVKNMPDAEDIVQDVFLTYMMKMPGFSSEEHRRNWLIRCTINRAKDMLRSVWRKNAEPVTEDIAWTQPESSEVMQMIWQLAPKYRIPLYLHYCEGYSLKEIAVILGKKPATVGTLLSRARKQLKEMLDETDTVAPQKGGHYEKFHAKL